MFPFERIETAAANVKGGENPPFTLEEFQEVYPHFWNGDGMALVPEPAMQMYLTLADACLKESRFKKAWRFCMCLFLAHFFTLYLQSAPDAQNAAAAGQVKGLVSSKSVDGVSLSYDFSTTLSDLDGWAMWKSTTYGAQLATFTKQYGRGMYIR